MAGHTDEARRGNEMNDIAQQLTAAMVARYPVIFVETAEEDRVVAALDEIVKTQDAKSTLTTWSSVQGLIPASDGDTCNASAALQAILKEPKPGFYVMKNLADFMDDPDVIRLLRDAYAELGRAGNVFIVIISDVNAVPETLSREVFHLKIPLPTPEAHAAAVKEIESLYEGVTFSEELHDKIGVALRGLTLKEAEHVLHGALSDGDIDKDNVLERIFRQKEQAVRKLGVLEYVQNRGSIASIGGMEILRDWVTKRKDLFTQKALLAGKPVPRGVLIMGVSGCGKSMCAKAVADLWDVPLFRLDMNLVFSGLYGNPNAAFQRALTGIESVAPAVLWIDEVENGLGMTDNTSSQEQTMTFSSFLTWMQERPPLIFVAATANRIESLPAEVIRKGRFDEVFFCDLPSRIEREQIISIHLKNNDVDLDEVDPTKLLYSTRGWSGAEIEQAIIAARIEANHAGRKPSLEDFQDEIRRMVPLSTTMSEQIKSIREWAMHRARRAAKASPKSMVPGEDLS